jgi:hypothetical protein
METLVSGIAACPAANGENDFAVFSRQNFIISVDD